MNSLLTKKKNVYLEKINENLISFFRNIEKFNQTFNELSEVLNGATVHINDIERILGNDDEDEGENEEENSIDNNEKELIAGGKLCELNQNLNISMREVRQTW